eukprot:gnl/TRDRNA2_/TRDRNA2_154960_c0_seq2.p1 gnl/TRDRNA2_/TRDRNA2_154960_c0~~gnl/TRDRNA2_/TRDRNA2_154960_c0_seq2.p1  ORF type:complete len:106 (-),score=7.15 gnl/TRDRNA2_/TRDRNA2_154960_c0_seq2:41-358(-)
MQRPCRQTYATLATALSTAVALVTAHRPACVGRVAADLRWGVAGDRLLAEYICCNASHSISGLGLPPRGYVLPDPTAEPPGYGAAKAGDIAWLAALHRARWPIHS